jgi:hypothetical protein
VTAGWAGVNIHQATRTRRAKDFSPQGGKSFGVAVCSGLLKKGQNSDEYLMRLPPARRFGFPPAAPYKAAGGADSTEQKSNTF